MEYCDTPGFTNNRRQQPMKGRKLNTKPVFTFHSRERGMRHEAKEGRIEPESDVK